MGLLSDDEDDDPTGARVPLHPARSLHPKVRAARDARHEAIVRTRLEIAMAEAYELRGLPSLAGDSLQDCE